MSPCGLCHVLYLQRRELCAAIRQGSQQLCTCNLLHLEIVSTFRSGRRIDSYSTASSNNQQTVQQHNSCNSAIAANRQKNWKKYTSNTLWTRDNGNVPPILHDFIVATHQTVSIHIKIGYILTRNIWTLHASGRQVNSSVVWRSLKCYICIVKKVNNWIM